MADTCQAKARKKGLMSLLALSGIIITLAERRIATRLSKEALGEMSFSKLASFMEGLELVQEDILCIACSIFGFGPLQNFYWGT